MRAYNIHEAKTQLSRLVEEAAQGEPFIIAKAGKPMVKVLRIDAAEKKGKRKLGRLEGMYTIPENFKSMFAPEIEEMFFGKDAK
jgi:prevent-host-death family protein